MAFCGRSGFKAKGFRLSPVQLLILASLNKEPAHGYVILQLIRDRLGNDWDLKSGTLYPALRSLEERGFIKGVEVPQDNRPDAIQYSLTKTGKQVLRSAFEGLDKEFRVFNNFWQFLGASAGSQSRDVLISQTMNSHSPIAFVALKRHCETSTCGQNHLAFLREYREYLQHELDWVTTRLEKVKQKGGEI